MKLPRGAPTTAVSFRVPNDLLAWIDTDIERRGKADRRDWFVALAQATRTAQELRDGRVQVKR